MPARTAYAPAAGEVLTSTNLARLAGGWIGYAEVTATQAGITTEVDLTGLSIAVTVNPSRRIRITADVTALSTGANEHVYVYIKEGATYLQASGLHLANTSYQYSTSLSAVITPTSGSHTYKVSLARASAVGSVTAQADANNPSFILVEDLGPA